MSEWRPISEADKTITFEHFFQRVNLTIRSSDPIWARDEDGREFECIWSEGKRDYWFDVENESPVDPVEWKPMPEEPTRQLIQAVRKKLIRGRDEKCKSRTCWDYGIPIT